jgi:hypothetical protein
MLRGEERLKELLSRYSVPVRLFRSFVRTGTVLFFTAAPPIYPSQSTAQSLPVTSLPLPLTALPLPLTTLPLPIIAQSPTVTGPPRPLTALSLPVRTLLEKMLLKGMLSISILTLITLVTVKYTLLTSQLCINVLCFQNGITVSFLARLGLARFQRISFDKVRATLLEWYGSDCCKWHACDFH